MASQGSLTVKWDEKFQLTLTSGEHTVVINRPAEDVHEHGGIGPIHLFMAGLGGCIMSVCGVFLDRRKIPIDDLRVELSWEYAENPYRIGKIEARLILPVKVDKRVSVALDKVAKSCTVHNTLSHSPEIKISIGSP